MIARNKLVFVFLFFIACLNLAVCSGHAFGREMLERPVVKLRSLDKVTARTMTFEADVGSTVKFGPLYIKVQACRKASPIELPEAAAFLQVWEITPEEEAEWVYSGWMFASSPGLASMDHSIYDVWVLDCLEEKDPEVQKEEQPGAREDEGVISEDQVPQKPASDMSGDEVN